MTSEDILGKRIDQIKVFLSNHYNAIFIGILIFAIIIRFYYFTKTLHQPLWWDEAEYLLMARAWAFGLDYNFIPVRPVLFSLITSLFMKVSISEFLPRVLISLFSIGSVIGMYLLGKEFYSKKVGLIAMFLMSIFYLNLFFSFRLLVELPSLTCFTFGALYFWRYLKDNSDTKSLYLAAAILAAGTLFRLHTATIFFAIILYLMITEKLNFIAKKELWIAGIIFTLILSPYLLWGYLQFDGFVIYQAGAWAPPQGSFIGNGINLFGTYLHLFSTYLSVPMILTLIFGCLSFYGVFVGFDLLQNKREARLRKELFLLLLFIVPIVIVSFSLGHVENRYILNSFPAIFIICSSAICLIIGKLKKYGKFVGAIFLIVLLGFSLNFQLEHSRDLIDSKIDSYSQVRAAGEWLQKNSDPKDIILSKSWPQIGYYSGREVITYPEEEEDLKTLISENKNIKFLTISIFESHPQWIYEYPSKNNLTVVNVQVINGDQPAFVTYYLKR
jgi:4-amino-4-deoxy-L-arabinose transferase-like glycosyltransferase